METGEFFHQLGRQLDRLLILPLQHPHRRTGLGMRIREYSDDVPKPMVPIGYRPILWHVMKYYAHYGHRDFILCESSAITRYIDQVFDGPPLRPENPALLPSPG